LLICPLAITKANNEARVNFTLEDAPLSTEKSRFRAKSQLAIVELRKARDMTQQALAVYMGRTTTTIGRWEAIRPPRGLSLVELAKVARDFKREDLAAVFEQELQRESAVIAGMSGLGALAHSMGVITSVPLEFAVRNMYEAAAADHSRNSAVYRAYRRLLRRIVADHNLLIHEIAKGNVFKQYLPDYLETLQIEIEEMEEKEDSQSEGK
jgi:transcriptional regulator with XRE-family HTH domain